MDRATNDIKSIKPSLNSVIAHKERMRRANMIAAGKNPDAPVQEVYSETEQKLLDEASFMSLQSHLNELRWRIIKSVLVVILFTGIAYFYSEELLHMITAPAGKLYYMKPTEAFFTYMKVSLYAGIMAASPVIIYHIWAFIMPALTKGEKKISNLLVPIAVIMFWLGIGFSYFFVLPAAVKFFIGFATDDLQPLFSIGQYLDFVISFVLPFGIVFELPLVVMIMAHFNLITSGFLKSKRKIFIFVAFVVGGAISPTPDIFSQTMIALPMIILYELSYYLTKHIMHK